VAGNTVSPEAGLRAFIAAELRLRRAQFRARIEEMAGQLLEAGSVRGTDLELVQLHLRRCPRQVERPLRRMRIVITTGELERALAARCDERRERHRCRLPRRQSYARAQRKDRVE